MYAVGGFDFPTSTGNYSVTGLGFQPVAVIMLGSNFSTVGTLMTGQTGPGLFISVNALDYSDGTTIRSLCLAPNGNSDANNANYRGYENGPISMQTNAGTATVVDYKANSISFDADGFSINVSTAAGSRRPIHWIAFGGDIGPTEPVAMVSSATKQLYASSSVTFNNAYEPRSALVVGTTAASGFGEGAVDTQAWFTFGSGHYPEISPNPNGWHSSSVWTQIELSSPLGRQGFTAQQVWQTSSADPTALNTSETIGALGPVLVEGFRRFRPNYGVDMTQMVNEGTIGANTWQYGLWWNGEGWTDHADVPDDGTVVVPRPANFKNFEAVLFSTVNGADVGGNTVPLRYGFGVLGPDYQGCVVFGQDGSCYQSVTRAAATCTASGANTASGTLNGSSFKLTNEEGGAVNGLIWHGFGNQGLVAKWIPHIYRILTPSGRQPVQVVVRPVYTTTGGTGTVGGTGGGVILTFTGYLTLEDTSHIVLEDDSGFLTL